MPESHLPDLAHRYGGKVQLKAATTCRFLLEAPPLSNVDRSGTDHGRPESVNRKVHAEKCFPQQLHVQLILPRTSRKPSTVVARPALASLAPGTITKTAQSSDRAVMALTRSMNRFMGSEGSPWRRSR